MMQQCTTETRLPNGLGLSQIQHVQEQHNYQNMHFIDTSAGAEPYNNFATHQMPPDMFDSPQEMQRRTLTQEQFDAFAQCAAMNGANYDLLQTGFSGDQAVMNQVFPELQHPDIKQQQSFVYQGEVPPSVSSYDSSIPSTTAEPPMPPFPSSNSIQDRTNFSSSSSDWTNSRSSSVAGSYHEEPFAQMSTPQQPPSVTTSQWQPGQSVPVDFNALNEEFRQAAASARQHPQHPQSHEQPLAFPADEAFVRRDSHTSTMLAQSMSNVGIHTPQPVQQGTFKSPAPPTSIAARRQRPGPLNLGRAALRSQSYSGAAQPASPGQMQPTSAAGGVHPLRRIRSTNIVNGVAQGRVQKSCQALLSAPHLTGPLRTPSTRQFRYAIPQIKPAAISHHQPRCHQANSLVRINLAQSQAGIRLVTLAASLVLARASSSMAVQSRLLSRSHRRISPHHLTRRFITSRASCKPASDIMLSPKTHRRNLLLLHNSVSRSTLSRFRRRRCLPRHSKHRLQFSSPCLNPHNYINSNSRMSSYQTSNSKHQVPPHHRLHTSSQLPESP
ncbi:hypothetical protein M433DRAFT_398533 [Acidomyces richmondensis BFW]|nr:MAG: hypothetical protein FE78DRAFT_292777 [Acidomyces sp. 'richmondensis']KYG48685.1 hypothetical protein M433DRAFT_398533 [Acidomyces richmondensis BFW]